MKQLFRTKSTSSNTARHQAIHEVVDWPVSCSWIVHSLVAVIWPNFNGQGGRDGLVERLDFGWWSLVQIGSSDGWLDPNRWLMENVLENGRRDRRLKRFEGKRLMILEGSVWLKCLSTRYDVTEASLVRDSLRRHLGVYRMTRLRSKWILAGSSVQNFRCLRTLELQDWNSGLRRFNSLCLSRDLLSYARVESFSDNLAILVWETCLETKTSR